MVKFMKSQRLLNGRTQDIGPTQKWRVEFSAHLHSVETLETEDKLNQFALIIFSFIIKLELILHLIIRPIVVPQN